VWGLALAGEEGVRTVLRGLLADVDLTLALSGHSAVAELDTDAVAPA
jgi:isopentenyl diphosphate isomerase/L-lactate dehydrogenase-like FMN-dependent dehydrogenase